MRCPCPVKSELEIFKYRKVPARTKLGNCKEFSLYSNTLPPNTIKSPGGTTIYELIERISRTYWDIAGDFEMIGESRLTHEESNFISSLWGAYRVGKTFTLPTAERIESTVLIAALLQLKQLKAILTADYFNPFLYREMAHSLENGNRYDETRKRWVSGEPYPSYLAHVWVREGDGFRRVTKQPAEVTVRWKV